MKDCPRCRALLAAAQIAARKQTSAVVGVVIILAAIAVSAAEPPTAGCDGCGVAVELPPAPRPRVLSVIRGGRVD